VILLCFVVAVVVPKAFFRSDWYRANATDYSIHLRLWIQPMIWTGCIAAGWFLLGQIGRRDGATLGVLIGKRRAVVGASVGFACSLPMLVVGLLSPQETDLSRLFYRTAQAGFFEEWLFRAFAFGLLVQLARWRIWPAALFSGAVFGLIHLGNYSLEGLMDEAGGLAFIGLGGVLYAWLFWRWNWNLWVVIALHLFMNLWWELWILDQNSLGVWAVTGSRIVAVGAAITLAEIARKRPALGRLLGIHTISR